jgi:hypothetical protein
MISKSNKPSIASLHVNGAIEERLIIDIDLNPVSHFLRKPMAGGRTKILVVAGDAALLQS